MPQPKVSVIIPVYNAGKYVERCLESVQNQTYKNIEIIFVNDGSTDNSGSIIDEIATAAPNIMSFHQENQGPAAARRTGVLKASGDYVMFLDSDDTLPLDAIEYMVTISLQQNLDAFYGLFNRIVDGKVYTIASRDFEGVISSDEMLKNAIDPNFVYVAAVCFSKREFWGADMFCKNRNLPSEDVITNVKLAIKCNRIGVYNKPIYNYHFVATSLTSTVKFFKQECFKDFFNQLKKVLVENDKEELTKDSVRMKEITTFGFLIKDIDTKDEWYKQIMAYDVRNYPHKIKVLHKLLHWPWLLHLFINGNRLLKQVISR